MAATGYFYSQFQRSLWNKEINLTSDSLKLLLCNGYVPDRDNHRYKSSVTNEVSAPGYTAGGLVVSSISISYDSGTKKLSFDGADVSWPTSTIASTHAVLYDSTPSTDATRPLIIYWDFGGTVSSTAATFAAVFDSTGIGAVAT